MQRRVPTASVLLYCDPGFTAWTLWDLQICNSPIFFKHLSVFHHTSYCFSLFTASLSARFWHRFFFSNLHKHSVKCCLLLRLQFSIELCSIRCVLAVAYLNLLHLNLDLFQLACSWWWTPEFSKDLSSVTSISHTYQWKDKPYLRKLILSSRYIQTLHFYTLLLLNSRITFGMTRIYIDS